MEKTKWKKKNNIHRLYYIKKVQSFAKMARKLYSNTLQLYNRFD